MSQPFRDLLREAVAAALERAAQVADGYNLDGEIGPLIADDIRALIPQQNIEALNAPLKEAVEALEPFAALMMGAGAVDLADDVVLLNTGSAIALRLQITVGDFRKAAETYTRLRAQAEEG